MIDILVGKRFKIHKGDGRFKNAFKGDDYGKRFITDGRILVIDNEEIPNIINEAIKTFLSFFEDDSFEGFSFTLEKNLYKFIGSCKPKYDGLDKDYLLFSEDYIYYANKEFKDYGFTDEGDKWNKIPAICVSYGMDTPFNDTQYNIMFSPFFFSRYIPTGMVKIIMKDHTQPMGKYEIKVKEKMYTVIVAGFTGNATMELVNMLRESYPERNL